MPKKIRYTLVTEYTKIITTGVILYALLPGLHPEKPCGDEISRHCANFPDKLYLQHQPHTHQEFPSSKSRMMSQNIFTSVSSATSISVSSIVFK